MGPSPLILRSEVALADAAAVRRVVVSTGMFNEAEIEVAEELVRERLARGLASGYEFLFAEEEGEVTGYVCYGTIAGTQHSFDLYWIAVAQRRQGQGLGKRLLVATESAIACRGGGRIYVETSGRAQYGATRAFYERTGYALEARLSNFYAPGDDKLIYVKVVAPQGENSPTAGG